MDIKHRSKLYNGFLKQVTRQNLKPSTAEVILPPAIKLPKKFKGSYIHSIVVSNSRWNGMNLNNITNRFNVLRVGGMYGKFCIKEDGQYKLSNYGKRILQRKKLKK